jgi:hypothetical protein
MKDEKKAWFLSLMGKLLDSAQVGDANPKGDSRIALPDALRTVGCDAKKLA